MGDYSKQHLQIAFDAFHQADFESASLHAKAAIQANSDCSTAYMCVVAAEYFLGNYEDAANYASMAEDNCNSPYQKLVLQKFTLHSANLIVEKAKTKEVTSNKKEKLVKHELQGCQ